MNGEMQYIAEEHLYHVSCMNKFRLTVYKDKETGRPKDAEMIENFNKICSWLVEEEDESDLYTVVVHGKMIQFR